MSINFRPLRLITLQITVLSFILCALPIPAASDSDTLSQPINDGPYLYRQNDSTIITMYLCNDTLVIDTTYSNGNEFRVPGLCYDSGSEYMVPKTGFEISPDTYSGVSRVFAISDIHGEYEYMIEILQIGGVIDSGLNWIWGNGHLVIDGDIFDRGDMVTECLWFLYRLEQEARLSGGNVHVLFGNHEEMIINGDNRYVNDKYMKGIVASTRINHQDLYGPDMVMGQWLRTKHTIIIINDVLYVHGGISPSFVDYGFTADMINEEVRRNLGINSVQYRFDEIARKMYGSSGPLWYRGFWDAKKGRYNKATNAGIDSILTFYNATSIVVGHTNMDSIMTHRDGRIFAIDVLFEDLGSLQALLWKDSCFYRVDGEGNLTKLR